MTLSASMGFTFTGNLYFNVSGTLTTNGKSMATAGTHFINGAGVVLTLGGAVTCAYMSVLAGTLAIGANTLTCTGTMQLANAAGSRNVTYSTGGSIVVTGTGTVLSTGTTGTNSYAGVIINSTGTGNRAFVLGNATGANSCPSITLSSSGTITGITAVRHFVLTSFTGSITFATSFSGYGNLTLGTSGTFTSSTITSQWFNSANVAFSSSGATWDLNTTISCTTSTVQVNIDSNFTIGSTRTFNLTNGTLRLCGTTGTLSSTLSVGTFTIGVGSTQVVVGPFSSSGGIALTSGAGTVINMPTMNLGGTTFTPTNSVMTCFKRDMTAGACTISLGNTAFSSAISSYFPVAISGSAINTLTISSQSKIGGFTCTSTNTTITGSFETTESVNFTGSTAINATGLSISFIGSSTTSRSLTCTTNGWSFANFTVANASATFPLTVAFTVISCTSFIFTSGNISGSNGTTHTIGTFSSATSNTRTLNLGTSTWNITGSGTAWDITTSTGMTLTASTSIISMSSSSSKTFAGGSLTYATLRQAGSGQLIIQGNNTFDTISNSTQPATVTFTSSTTTTITTNFSLSGTAGSPITINSSSVGTRHTLTKASGVVSVNYCSIQDSNATGGATWRAFTTNGNTNSGNNLGWIFAGASAAMLLLFS